MDKFLEILSDPELVALLKCSVLPGALGGFIWFWVGLNLGRIKKGKRISKFILETVGGAVVGGSVGYPLAPLFTSSLPVFVFCFAVGVGWSSIIQLLRQEITRIIRVRLARIEEETSKNSELTKEEIAEIERNKKKNDAEIERINKRLSELED